ncbi:MAG: sugar-binding protein [Thiolinea sp.]
MTNKGKLGLGLLLSVIILAGVVFLVFTPASLKQLIQPQPNGQSPSSPLSHSGGSTHSADNVIAYQSPAALQADIPLIPPVGKRPPIGINANELHHEDASFPFVDLFRQADPFADNTLELSDSEQVEYDEQGWPVRLNGAESGTKFIGKMPAAALPEGEYIVLYDGHGELRYGHDVERVEAEQGRQLIRFNPAQDGNPEEIDASLVITRSSESDPLRNIRILPPGGICQNNPYQWVSGADECAADTRYLSFEYYYSSILFNPDYLNFIRDFSVIRFMAMSGITRNPERYWHERPNLQEATWGGGYGERGAPLEIQVELANRMQADAWFNLPHAADDEYVRNFATYVRDNLAPGLKAYIEYTNEVWNTSFSHSEYTQKMGIEAGYSINSVEAGFQYYVQRAGEVFSIWEEVFGGRQRFVRVIGSWDTRPDISRKLLGVYEGYKHADALAIAPYFGGNTKGYREASTVDEVLQLTGGPDSFRSLEEILEHIHTQVEIAHQFGVKLIAYEGGQGLVDWATREPDQHPNPLFFAANRDPRMGPMYTRLLQGWKDAGGDLFVMFSSPRTCQWFGCWGLKEHIRQPRSEAPKYNATLDFIEANRDWEFAEFGERAGSTQAVSTAQAEHRPRAADEPVIVFRPANDPERYFFLENPRTLDTLIAGKSWVKRDLFGKWQGKWDRDYLYLSVQVYDETIQQDSPNPEDDDSIEFYIDADNSRYSSYDGVNDFRMIFAWGREQVILDEKSPQTIHPDLQYELFKTEDGYKLHARIPWAMLGVQADVRHRVGIEVQVNDDDDGGEREQKISWLAQEDNAMNDPRLFGVVLISGR